MSALPEPRCFAATTVDPLSRLAAEAAQAPDATQRLGLLNQLHNALREAVASGRDDLLRHATTNVISPVAGLALLEALDQVIDTSADPAGDRAARVFALPVVLVAAGLAGAEISGPVMEARHQAYTDRSRVKGGDFTALRPLDDLPDVTASIRSARGLSRALSPGAGANRLRRRVPGRLESSDARDVDSRFPPL